MAEKIENIGYQKDSDDIRFKSDLFYNGPMEFLCVRVAEELKKEIVFDKLFKGSIVGYKRMDFPIRELPAVRIYNDRSTKSFDSWFIEGDLVADIIFPASTRRDVLQQIQDTVSAALLQQFRRPSFFLTLTELIPSLNELGKRFDMDKSLGFQAEEDGEECPLTQIRINFRMDLRVWDEYLEETNRTKDEPFKEILGTLDRIVAEIQGLKDDNQTVEKTEGIDQKIE